MNNATKVLSLIERTNNLGNYSSKTITANTTASSINNPESSSPVKRIKKPPSASISESIPKSPISRGQSSNKNLFNQIPNSESLSKSSLDFVKNINFALSDFAQTSEIKLKKFKEHSSSEQKTLTYIRHLVKEQKKSIQPSQKREKVQGLDLAEQNLKNFTQEAAQEICLLEKKCSELEEENKKLQVLADSEIRVQREEEKVENIEHLSGIKLKSIEEVLQILRSDHVFNDKSGFSALKKSRIHGTYAPEIDLVIANWVSSTHLQLDHTSFSALSAFILKKIEKTSNRQKSFSKSLIRRSKKREKLENALNSSS